MARVEQAVCSRRTKGDRTAVSAPTRTAAWVMMAGMVLLGGCATQGSGSMRDEDQARPEQAGGEPVQGETPSGGVVANAPVVADAPLRGTEWRLQSLAGKPLPDIDGAVPTLVLQPDNDGFGGFSGCNRYFGSYRLDEDGHLASFGSIGVTKRMCGIAQMRAEGAFLGVLRKRVRLLVQGQTLSFFDEGGQELARFRAAAGTQP